MTLEEEEKSGSPGISENLDISFKKVEIAIYVYKKYNKILMLILNILYFKHRNVQCNVAMLCVHFFQQKYYTDP